MPRHAYLIPVMVIAVVACTGDGIDDQTDDTRVVSTPAAPPSSNSTPPETLPPPPTLDPSTERTTTPTPPSAVVTTPPTVSAPATPNERNVVAFDSVSFDLPTGWEQSGPVVATEFAAGAECVAGAIVDFEPPTDDPGEGEAAFRQQSSVQVCVTPTDGRTLDEFMDATYADRSGFEPVSIGGLDGYRSGTARDSISFAQSRSLRYQVVVSVAAAPALESQRLAEAAVLVGSLSLG